MPSNYELDLFRQTMADVAPIQQDKVQPTPPDQYNPSQTQLTRQFSAQHLLTQDIDNLSLEYAEMVKPDDVISFKRCGVQDGVFRKLRLGKYDIHARLDLHQMTLEKARGEIIRFLRQCQRMDIRTALIVHGKGERSMPQALMKSFVCQWLEQITDVQCFHSAQRHHGGTGALYVLVKKSQEKKLETRERHLNHLA